MHDKKIMIWNIQRDANLYEISCEHTFSYSASHWSIWNELLMLVISLNCYKPRKFRIKTLAVNDLIHNFIYACSKSYKFSRWVESLHHTRQIVFPFSYIHFFQRDRGPLIHEIWNPNLLFFILWYFPQNFKVVALLDCWICIISKGY